MHAGNLGRSLDRKRTGRKRMLTGAVLTYIKRWLNSNPQRYKFEAGSWQINTEMLVPILACFLKLIKYAILDVICVVL